MCGPCFSDLASCIRWPLWPKGPRHRSSPTGTSHENGSGDMAGTRQGCCCRGPGLPFVVYAVGLPWRLLLNGWQARGTGPSLTDVAPCVAHAGSRPCGELQCAPLPRKQCRASPTEATLGRLAPDYAICRRPHGVLQAVPLGLKCLDFFIGALGSGQLRCRILDIVLRSHGHVGGTSACRCRANNAGRAQLKPHRAG